MWEFCSWVVFTLLKFECEMENFDWFLLLSGCFIVGEYVIHVKEYLFMN